MAAHKDTENKNATNKPGKPGVDLLVSTAYASYPIGTQNRKIDYRHVWAKYSLARIGVWLGCTSFFSSGVRPALPLSVLP